MPVPTLIAAANRSQYGPLGSPLGFGLPGGAQRGGDRRTMPAVACRAGRGDHRRSRRSLCGPHAGHRPPLHPARVRAALRWTCGGPSGVRLPAGSRRVAACDRRRRVPLSRDGGGASRSSLARTDVNAYKFVWPIWDGRRALTEDGPLRVVLMRRSAIALVGAIQNGPEVHGRIEARPEVLHHQPAYNNFTWKTAMTKQRRWARLHGNELTRPFAELPTFNYTGPADWPTAAGCSIAALSRPCPPLRGGLFVRRSGTSLWEPCSPALGVKLRVSFYLASTKTWSSSTLRAASISNRCSGRHADSEVRAARTDRASRPDQSWPSSTTSARGHPPRRLRNVDVRAHRRG